MTPYIPLLFPKDNCYEIIRLFKHEPYLTIRKTITNISHSIISDKTFKLILTPNINFDTEDLIDLVLTDQQKECIKYALTWF